MPLEGNLRQHQPSGQSKGATTILSIFYCSTERILRLRTAKATR